MKKSMFLSLFIFLGLSLASQTVIAYISRFKWKPTVILGCGLTTANQTQTLRLDDAPSPGLDNRYVGQSTLNGTVLVGLALEKELKPLFHGLIPEFGPEIDFLRNQAVIGTVEP